MDRRAVERTLLLLIWLVEAGVTSKKEDEFSRGDTGSWKSRPTVAIYEDNDTTTQQQNNKEMTTTAQMPGNSTEVAMATSYNSNSNETTPSTIMTTSTNSTEAVFASTPSAAAAAANSSSSDAAPNILASNASEVSAAANSSSNDAAPNILAGNASEATFSNEAFTNASTMANIPNSATTQVDSNSTDAVTNSPNLNYATMFGTDGYNWSTTQNGGGGGGGNGDGVATGAQVTVRAEDPSSKAYQEGSWNTTTTPLFDDNNSNSSTVPPQTDREVTITTAQMVLDTNTASAMPAENSAAASAGPVNYTLPFSASNAFNNSNDNASENFLTSTGFTNATTMANIPNSAATEPGSNATDAVTNAQNPNHATMFGTDSYNWSTTQNGGGGGDGGNVTGVRAALGAENPFPDDPGSWNSTTAIYYNDSQGNTTQPPGKESPAVPPTDNNANNSSATTANSSISATPPANSTADTFPSAPASSANSSDTARDFPADSASQSTYTTTTPYFDDANTTADNSSNPLKPDLVSNTTFNASDGQMNGTDFGNGDFNWTIVTTQSSGGVAGGGGNWSNSSISTSSNSTTGNQTANMTTVSSDKTIPCYNCSGDNCSQPDNNNNNNNNNTATCVSNTGICYMQYDAVATALSYSCVPLLSGDNGCPSAYATRVAKTVCEMCCTAPLCNQRSPSELEQMCRHQLRSSVDSIGGGGRRVRQLVAAALIAAIHYCTFFATASFGDW